MLSSLRGNVFEAKILSNDITNTFSQLKFLEEKLVKLTKKHQTKKKNEIDQETKEKN